MAERKLDTSAVGGYSLPVSPVKCQSCGGLIGRGYPNCTNCADQVNQLWLTSWQKHCRAIRTSDPVSEQSIALDVVFAQPGQYSALLLQAAMELVDCAQCGARIGFGALECVGCARMMSNLSAQRQADVVTSRDLNHYWLSVARLVLKAPHRYREPVTLAWRLLLPFLLVGVVPDNGDISRIRAHVIAGRYQDLALCSTYPELRNFPELFWRKLDHGNS